MAGGEGVLRCGHAREKEEGRGVPRQHAKKVERASVSGLLCDGGGG